MQDKNNIDSKGPMYYILIVLVILILLYLNIDKFKELTSSNSAFINNYAPQEDKMEEYRNPAVAGLFYEADKDRLNEQVSRYLKNSAAAEQIRPKIIVVPHAGYTYSAATAAKAFAVIEKYKDEIKNIIILGPSHKVAFNGAALSGADYFKTPLGKIKLNKKISAELLQNKGFIINNAAHAGEHSIEVQLPFVQKIFTNAQIVPIVYSNAEPQTLAKALLPYLKNDQTLIIVSADLSHYYQYDTAQKLDRQTADLIAKKEPLDKHLSCGAIGINTALLLAKEQNLSPNLLELVNSGDVSGDKSQVVGYGAWTFTPAKEKKALTPLELEAQNLQKYAKTYGAQIMEIAHKAVVRAASGKKYQPSHGAYDKHLFDKGASFVTLKKGQKLRGCIGTFAAHQALANDIAQNAYMAANDDIRFSPLTKEEIKDLNISVSLLSSFEEIKFSSQADLLQQIKPKTDGLILTDGNRRGLFLPSVWEELPNKQDFLDNLKLKAGLTPAYWSDNIKIFRFKTVEIKDEN